MNRSFVIGDTHFGHENILKYEPVFRPFKTISEHNEELIKRWNSVVGPNDIVWHLGDVLFGQDNFPLLKRLNGRKNLLLGNHDVYAPAMYHAAGFQKILPYAKYRGVLFSHIPVHPCQIGRYRGNVHGHMHSKNVGDPRYINVSVEQINLTPILLDKVLAQLPELPKREERNREDE